MKAKEKAKKKPRSLKVPKSVQDSIPYHMVYPENGIIETEPGHFCHAYKLTDCNFSCAVKQNKSICSIAMVSF